MRITEVMILFQRRVSNPVSHLPRGLAALAGWQKAEDVCNSTGPDCVSGDLILNVILSRSSPSEPPNQ